MDIAFYIFGIIFLFVAMFIISGGLKKLKAPSELTVSEYERNKSLAIAILCPAIGLLLIGKNLYDRHVTGIADPMLNHSLVLGSAAILYGLYRGWLWLKEK